MRAVVGGDGDECFSGSVGVVPVGRGGETQIVVGEVKVVRILCVAVFGLQGTQAEKNPCVRVQCSPLRPRDEFRWDDCQRTADGRAGNGVEGKLRPEGFAFAAGWRSKTMRSD